MPEVTSTHGAVRTVAIALIPLTLGALVTVAWQNSHSLTELRTEVEHITVDLERTKASLEPGRTIMLRLDKNEDELKHQRELIEQRLNCK
jgi:hypothetical protein